MIIPGFYVSESDKEEHFYKSFTFEAKMGRRLKVMRVKKLVAPSTKARWNVGIA